MWGEGEGGEGAEEGCADGAHAASNYLRDR